LQQRKPKARACAEGWARLFSGRFYLELQKLGAASESHYLPAAAELGAELGLPLVATNDVRFIAPGDFEAHEARVCIAEGRTLADPRRIRRYTPQQYFRSGEEMQALFAELPEALANTLEIAKRCNLELPLGQTFLPTFPLPQGEDTDTWCKTEAKKGLEHRLTQLDIGPQDGRYQAYHDRLAEELGIITRTGFTGYYLIVADFIQWAKSHGVPVGPGRGSGAGSLVAYALGITDLDPIAFDLLFERFLNPERVSLPDFDIDFCMEGRDAVIDYVVEKYGEDRVAQILTVGTMAAKAVVRDVGRVLGHPYGFVDSIAKQIPFEVGITLEKALQEEVLRDRYQQDEEVREILDLARKLEGLARNIGKHAGGVVIAPRALTDFMPLYSEAGGSGVLTQLDKYDVEAIGLVKFDFLGLRTLTIIDKAVKEINTTCLAEGQSALDITGLKLQDEESLALIRDARTTAVFQFESRVMKDLTKRLQPTCFDDVIALNALIRPGPSELADDFINRKHGRAQVQYLHPMLEPILKPTYGVILYQEQVMQIARTMAGYTLGEADVLRAAMGKKNHQEMALQRGVFVEGARHLGVDARQADSIFELMAKFASYGFNKSHSTAYALIAYQTAWLKAHHPAAFMASVLSSDMDNTDKVMVFRDDCRELGLHIAPPHVNESDYAFRARSDGVIRYGLGAIKGVGRAVVEAIVAERESAGPYEDLFDFCRRATTGRLNRRAMEALIRSGATDELGPTRAAMMATLPKALQYAEQYAQAALAGQNDMFGSESNEPIADAGQFVEVPEWSDEERLKGEKETLGLYVSGHPIERYQHELDRITSMRLADARAGTDQTQVVAGLVVSLRTVNSRKGRMAIATLDDNSARLDAVVYSDLYKNHRDNLGADKPLVMVGKVTTDEWSGGYAITASEILDLDQARHRFARGLCLRVENQEADSMLARLENTLTASQRGNTPVSIDYFRSDARARLMLDERWRVMPSEGLLARLRDIFGPDGVEVEY